jgi:hypothetical protein
MTTIKIKCGFVPVNGEAFFRKSAWDKGKGLSEAGHVRQVEEVIQDSDERTILAKCLPQTNVNSRDYDLSIKVRRNHYCK